MEGRRNPLRPQTDPGREGTGDVSGRVIRESWMKVNAPTIC